MTRKKLSEAQKKATQKYRKKNIEKIRKQSNERKLKFRMKKRLLRAREDEMKDKFEEMKPVLFKWATFFATWDRYFEIHELVNVAFSHGGLRRIKNPKLLSKKAKWVMQDYMRKVRAENNADELLREYVREYGILPSGKEVPIK